MSALNNPMDTRPRRNGWAPGDYLNTCYLCNKQFVGDKRAVSCAPCAYKEPHAPAPKLTAEEAFRRAAISDPEDAAIALSELASLGYTLIPTDPASVEDLVERVMRKSHPDGFMAWGPYENCPDDYKALLRENARAVLAAAIPGFKAEEPAADKRQVAQPDSCRQSDSSDRQ